MLGIKELDMKRKKPKMREKEAFWIDFSRKKILFGRNSCDQIEKWENFPKKKAATIGHRFFKSINTQINFYPFAFGEASPFLIQALSEIPAFFVRFHAAKLQTFVGILRFLALAFFPIPSFSCGTPAF